MSLRKVDEKMEVTGSFRSRHYYENRVFILICGPQGHGQLPWKWAAPSRNPTSHRHSRESGNPGSRNLGSRCESPTPHPWIPACAGMTVGRPPSFSRPYLARRGMDNCYENRQCQTPPLHLEECGILHQRHSGEGGAGIQGWEGGLPRKWERRNKEG